MTRAARILLVSVGLTLFCACVVVGALVSCLPLTAGFILYVIEERQSLQSMKPKGRG